MIENILKNLMYDKVTLKVIKFWFDFLNDKIFDNELEFFDYVTFDDLDEDVFYGMLCYYNDDEVTNTFELRILSTLEPKRFLSTLLHEMIHLYQGQIQKNYDFGEPSDDPIFSYFKSRSEDFGIDPT